MMKNKKSGGSGEPPIFDKGLHVRLPDGLDVVEIENGDQDEGGEAGVEAAVVKDEAAVHLGSYCANDRAHKAGKNAVAEAVLASDRTKSGGECQAVDVRLCGERPRDVKAGNEADKDHKDEQRNVANHYREDVFDMMTVSRKGKGGKYDSRCCAGEANTIGQAGNDGGDHKDEIEICEHHKAVYGNIDHTDRHAEFVGEIGAILYSELNEVTKSIDNLMKAIEQGIVTSTTKERLQEPEGRRDELKGRIKVEDSKARIKLTKPEILRLIGKAIRKEPAQMIRLLIKEIVYDDKSEVYYNTSERTRPDGEDTHQAFCFYTETFCYENLALWFTMKCGSITNIDVSLLI